MTIDISPFAAGLLLGIGTHKALHAQYMMGAVYGLTGAILMCQVLKVW